MIIITGHIELKPDLRDRAIELGCEHSSRSRQEEGCISHNCYLDAEDPNRMHFFESWYDMAAVQRHFAVAESGSFVKEISALANTRPEIAIYSAERIEAAPF